MDDVVCSAWLSSLACLSCCTRRARGRIVRTEITGKGAAGETAPPWAFEIDCSSWNHVPPPTWQQCHHLERITIDPHGELGESLTIEGMGWVSDRDLTIHS